MGMTKDAIDLQLKIRISKRWVPAFIGFINKLQRNSDIGHSSVVAFYADGDGDFGFKALIPWNENPELMRDFGFDNWEGRRVVDQEKAVGKPVCKDLEVPNAYFNKIEEVYDAG